METYLRGGDKRKPNNREGFGKDPRNGVIKGNYAPGLGRLLGRESKVSAGKEYSHAALIGILGHSGSL